MANYILYRIGKFLSFWLPRRAAYAIALFLSSVHFVVSRKDRRRLIDNLKIIVPDAKNHTTLARQVFHNFAKYLVDFFRTEKLNKQNLSQTIRVVNLHAIDTALRVGRGVIILTAHLGNWELGGVAMSLLGYSFYGIALPHKDKRVNDFFNHQRQVAGEKVIQLGSAARRCMECLANNEIIALLGDRDFTPGGVVIDFFGRRALIPKGPAGFSLKTGAMIVPGFVIRQPDDTFELVFEDPIEPVSTGDKERDILSLTQKITAVIERYIRRYPSQWLMFREFWIR